MARAKDPAGHRLGLQIPENGGKGAGRGGPSNLGRPLIASSTRDLLLIAASDRARASGSLDGYRPAAPVAPVIGIIVIPTIIMLTVAGSTNVN